MNFKIVTFLISVSLPFFAQGSVDGSLTLLPELNINGNCDCHHPGSNQCHNQKDASSFGYFYATTEPVILYGEKIPLFHKSLHTKNLSQNIARDEIIFGVPGSYLITYNLTAKRVSVQTGTHIPINTVSGGFLAALYLYETHSGLTVEIPGTRYGVLTQFRENGSPIESQQLFAQVIVKIRRSGSRLSLRSLTPALIDSTTTTAMQLQARVSNEDYLIEPNVSAAITIQKL